MRACGARACTAADLGRVNARSLVPCIAIGVGNGHPQKPTCGEKLPYATHVLSCVHQERAQCVNEAHERCGLTRMHEGGEEHRRPVRACGASGRTACGEAPQLNRPALPRSTYSFGWREPLRVGGDKSAHLSGDLDQPDTARTPNAEAATLRNVWPAGRPANVEAWTHVK